MFLVDRGETLGETLGLFQNVYYDEKKDTFSGFPEYTFRKKMTDTLHTILRNRSIAYEADEATLPKLVPILKRVALSKDAIAHYDEVKSQFKAAITSTGVRDLQLIKNTFLRMRQISSGFIGYYDDDTGTRAAFAFDDNPKLEMLLSLVREIQADHKLIIFNQFTFSGSIIARELEREKINHVRIYGKTKNQSEVLSKYKNDDDCRVLLLNNDCGGFGLNLHVARYGIYFESPTCPIMRKQTRRRYERQGSKFKSVFQYDLVTNGTNDEDNLASLAAGRDLLEDVLKGRRKSLV
jgi:SNF2 family DNA or RNA helicase